MTVAELIETLKRFTPGMRVVVQGYEDGYDDIASVRPISIKPGAHQEWYYGRHGDATQEQDGAEQAVLLFSRDRRGVDS